MVLLELQNDSRAVETRVNEMGPPRLQLRRQSLRRGDGDGLYYLRCASGLVRGGYFRRVPLGVRHSGSGSWRDPRHPDWLRYGIHLGKANGGHPRAETRLQANARERMNGCFKAVARH
jgi:hypothetical protein